MLKVCRAMLNSAMNHYEPLCPTFNGNDPKWPTMTQNTSLWPIMNQKLENRFAMTQNNVLEPLFSFSQNPCLKSFVRANLVPKLESAMFKMKLGTNGYSRLSILNLTIAFLIFASKIPLLDKSCPETSKCFEWKSIQRGTQGCWFQISQFFS